MLENRDVVGPLKVLVSRLVSGNFGDLEKAGQLGNATAADLAEAICSYPDKLSMPPQSAFDDLDIYEGKGELQPTWFIDFDLWADGSKSQLTLVVMVRVDAMGKLTLSVRDCRVM
jgi:hypothetical protein